MKKLYTVIIVAAVTTLTAVLHSYEAVKPASILQN